MFTTLENGIGLEIILWLQSSENPVFNVLAEIFAILGGDFGYLLLLPIIYWAVDKHLGRWLLVVLTLSLFVLIGSKELFERPRPYIHAPDEVLLLITPSSGFGFPSGHVGLSTAIWGFVVLWARRRWTYVVLPIYLLLMAWSRMYGGVHFPQDVVGGFLLGGAVAVGLYVWRNPLNAYWERIPVIVQAVTLVIAGAVMALLLINDEAGVSGAGILIGGGFGVMMESTMGRFAVAGAVFRRVLRIFLGLILTLIVFVLLDFAFESLLPEPLFRVIRYGLVTLVILGVYPLLAIRTSLADVESNQRNNPV